MHGSVGNGPATWGALQPLAERYELVVPNRGGYPPHPQLERIDFEQQAEELAPLLADGAHLVGHSYGGVISLLIAARHPGSVRSLTVNEPPAFGVARGRPEIEKLVAGLDAFFQAGPHEPEGGAGGEGAADQLLEEEGQGTAVEPATDPVDQRGHDGGDDRDEWAAADQHGDRAGHHRPGHGGHPARVGMRGGGDPVEFGAGVRGFDPADPSLSKSLGLLGMRERAAILGGRVNISSAPGKGTSVTVWIPLQLTEESGGMS